MKLEQRIRLSHICYDETAHNQGIVQQRYKFMCKIPKLNCTFDGKRGYKHER